LGVQITGTGCPKHENRGQVSHGGTFRNADCSPSVVSVATFSRKQPNPRRMPAAAKSPRAGKAVRTALVLPAEIRALPRRPFPRFSNLLVVPAQGMSIIPAAKAF